MNRSESATFSGPNSVSNIISRVTGGNPSNIDGLIRSTIPNADMYTAHGHNLNFYVGGRQQSFRATASSLGKS